MAKLEDYASSDLTEREKLALEFTERLIFDPHGLDNDFFARLKRHFTNGQIVEMGLIVMVYNGAGRFNAAIDLEPLNPHGITVVEGALASTTHSR
ncbi:MAG: hypothetical protein HYX97_06030 [Chloroflexi bacterium]|nr:hypothetical protein [Chloroflexota bacterium]